MHHTIFKFLVAILFCAFQFTHGSAQSDNQNSRLITESEDFIKEKMKSDSIIGVCVGIIINDSVIWKKGFGFADKEQKTPMTESTVINIGSVTKTFTALSVMQLYEKKLININEPLVKYLPQFKPEGQNLNKVTVKSVITHTSGIQSDFWKNSDLASGKYTDVVRFINETHLLYPAGMVGLYSNSGYNILGNLIKQVSRQDYPEYIHKNIFTPLYMTSSGFAMDSLKGRTKVYARGKEVKEYELRDIASGGIYTNINDFVKYAKALLESYASNQSPIIKQATIKEMFSLQNKDVPIETNKKGLGWFMFKNDSSFAMYHAGSAGFAHANILLIPGKKAAVIIMTNTAEGGSLTEDFCFNFLSKYQLKLNDLFPPRVVNDIHKKIQFVSLAEAALKKHEGDYAQIFSVVNIRVENDTLKMLDGDKHYNLIPITENEFIPVEIFGNDSSKMLTDKRYCFRDIDDYHVLFKEDGDKESQAGYKLNEIDTTSWKKKLGSYEHFGYQMLAGDTKFTRAELYMNNDVLMLKLKTPGGDTPIPLNVISGNVAQTGGLSTSFGYTVQFRQDENYDILDFAGLTFRKKK
jgi:CubicO group peptidase (beta-lactamase class C family)